MLSRNIYIGDIFVLFPKQGGTTCVGELRQVRSEVRTKDLEDYPEMVYHQRIM